jgi:hypothetical protein
MLKSIAPKLLGASMLATLLSAWALPSACSSGGGSGSGSGTCRNLEGQWQTGGDCPGTRCTATQSGCSISVSCQNGGVLSGSVSESGFSLTGSAGGTSVSCSGSFTRQTTAAGSCNVGGQNCAWQFQCVGGPCAESGGGSGGSPTGSGAAPGAGGSSCLSDEQRCVVDTDCCSRQCVDAGGQGYCVSGQ